MWKNTWPWSPDGATILAGDDDPIRLMATVKALGHDASEVLIASVPPPDLVLLGQAGFLQYFTAEFDGEAKEVVLNPKPSFPGRRV